MIFLHFQQSSLTFCKAIHSPRVEVESNMSNFTNSNDTSEVQCFFVCGTPLKLTLSPLKIHGWKMNFLLGRLGLFSGATLLVSVRVAICGTPGAGGFCSWISVWENAAIQLNVWNLKMMATPGLVHPLF